MARRKQKHNNNQIKTYLLIATIIITITAIAYSTCKKQQTQSTLADPDTTALAQVDHKQITDGQMLHYPGFDILYSPRDRQPYYAAWIITPQTTANTTHNRSNNFRPDPNVENTAQLADYRNSGYDRGHIVPSADMRYSKEAQDACFYLTNISPQNNNLNSKAWAKLEEQCRQWVMRDSTLIIVAGPILTDHLTQTIGPNKVTVPDRYFKVILAPYTNPPRAIGFIMPNTYVEGGVQATATTVDQVEEITGLDFFAALPDDIENQIESTAHYNQWQHSKHKHNK